MKLNEEAKVKPEVIMYCPIGNRMFFARQQALVNAYAVLSKHYSEYQKGMLKLLLDDKKKPWPRKKSKRFHKMRVGA